MNIRTKTLGINSIAILAALAVIYFALVPHLMSGFEVAEREAMHREVSRAADGLNDQSDRLSKTLQDWSVWTDTYDFIAGKNPAYITSNFGDSEFYETPLTDHIYYFNSTDERVFDIGSSAGWEGILDHLRPGSPFFKYGAGEVSDYELALVKGLVSTDSGLALVAARPILHSDGTGPSRGTLVFVRYITDEYTDGLAKIWHSEFAISRTSSGQLPGELHEDAIAERVATQVIDDHKIAGYTIRNDIYGKPAALIEVRSDRSIQHQGIQTVKTFLAIMAVVGTIIVLIIAGVLEWLVVRPITRLTHLVTATKNEAQLLRQLQLKGSDEVAQLSTSIASMLHRIANSNKEVTELVSELEEEKEDVEHIVRQRTRQLEEEQSQFLASINSLPLGFVLTNAQGKILMRNPAVTPLFDASIENIEDLPPGTGAQDLSLFRQIRKQFHRTVRYTKVSTGEVSTNDGKSYYIWVVPVLRHNNHFGGTVVLIEDVTEARIFERSREEFFSIASHELRTPLTAIRGNTSLIKQLYAEQLQDKDLSEMVDDIHSSSVRLINIVNDFLDVSSLEQRKMKLDMQDFNVQDVINAVATELGSVFAAKGVALNIEPAASGNAIIRGDFNRMKQVVYNMVGNALKFTEAGSVTVRTEVDHANVRILFKDTGPGISAKSRQLLFHKFQQGTADIHTRETPKGTGLGLYISKLIIREFKGTIQLDETREAESSPNSHGSTFSIVLPRVRQ